MISLATGSAFPLMKSFFKNKISVNISTFFSFLFFQQEGIFKKLSFCRSFIKEKQLSRQCILFHLETSPSAVMGLLHLDLLIPLIFYSLTSCRAQTVPFFITGSTEEIFMCYFSEVKSQAVYFCEHIFICFSFLENFKVIRFLEYNIACC